MQEKGLKVISLINIQYISTYEEFLKKFFPQNKNIR